MVTDSTSHSGASGTDEADPLDESRMTLGEHLNELRIRVFRSAAAFALAFVVLYTFREPMLEFVMMPFRTAGTELNETVKGVFIQRLIEEPELEWSEFFSSEPVELPKSLEGFDFEGFMETHRADLVIVKAERFPDEPQSIKAPGPFIQKIKTAVWLSLFIAGPFFLWEMWMFVAAGLYKAERRVVYSFFPIMLLLFLVGVVFGFMFMVPNAIYFLQVDGFGTDAINRQMTLDDYMQFLRGLSLALGFVFQLPVAQVVLSKTGVVDPKLYAKYRGHMAIVALVVAMFLTPPDPITQMLLAGPAIVLWEIGYWVSRFFWTPPEIDLDAEALTGGGAA